MRIKDFDWRLILYALFFIVFFGFIFSLGKSYQKQKDIKNFKKIAYPVDYKAHGKCPYWGIRYSYEFEIAEKYKQNAVGRVDAFSGQIVDNGGDFWSVKTPIHSSGFKIDAKIEFPDGNNLKKGDCITFISDTKGTFAVYRQ